MSDVGDKLAYFQAITGVEDTQLCTDILSAHGWDLETAISSFTSTSTSDNHLTLPTPTPTPTDVSTTSPPFPDTQVQVTRTGLVAPLAWKLITLPFSIISASLRFGFWAAGALLSYYSLLTITPLNSNSPTNSSSSLASVSAATREAMDFVLKFERQFGNRHPNFVPQGFMDALQSSRQEYKLLFVYLHSPDHPDTPLFCETTLCSELLTPFINENFVAWGATIRASEGFKMSNTFKASTYPFSAVVMPATNQRIALLHQVEGPKSPEEMLTALQRVLEESAPVLVTARLDAEERRNNMRLREEQDAAYRAALEADQARERQRREEQERLEREAVEAERKQREEEEARERAEREAAEKAAALVRLREEKAQSLGAEPEKGPDVTQVLVRFPSGERKGRRFHCTNTLQSLYDYVDSLGCLEVENYTLVSNFPRVLYGPEKLNLSLKEVGLHPQASLFVEMNS